MNIRAKFDKEYSTQWKDEVEYLKQRGIRYTFVKRTDEISAFKYTKTQELFEALASFYGEIERKRFNVKEENA